MHDLSSHVGGHDITRAAGESSAVPAGGRITAQSAHLPGTRLPISLSNPSARAPPRVHSASAASASSPARSAAARASESRSSSPTLTTESVPTPTRRPAASSAPSGAAPCPCARLESGQWAIAAPALPRRPMSARVARTRWMQRVRSPSTPWRSSHATGVPPSGEGIGIPRTRHASAKGPVPCSRSSVSAADSATCTASGSPSSRAQDAVAA